MPCQLDRNRSATRRNGDEDHVLIFLGARSSQTTLVNRLEQGSNACHTLQVVSVYLTRMWVARCASFELPFF